MSDATSTDGGSGLRAHSFLALVVGLVAVNVFLLIRGGDAGHGPTTSLVVAIALFFHHIAHRYVTVGWPRKAMLGLSYVWTGFAFVYMIWLIE